MMVDIALSLKRGISSLGSAFATVSRPARAPYSAALKHCHFSKPSVDDSKVPFIDRWHMVKGNTELPIFVSAHISRENVGEILGLEPSGIIIGTSVVQADNPLKEITDLSELVKNN